MTDLYDWRAPLTASNDGDSTAAPASERTPQRPEPVPDDSTPDVDIEQAPEDPSKD
jgi:hypothetical protein